MMNDEQPVTIAEQLNNLRYDDLDGKPGWDDFSNEQLKYLGLRDLAETQIHHQEIHRKYYLVAAAVLILANIIGLITNFNISGLASAVVGSAIVIGLLFAAIYIEQLLTQRKLSGYLRIGKFAYDSGLGFTPELNLANAASLPRLLRYDADKRSYRYIVRGLGERLIIAQFHREWIFEDEKGRPHLRSADIDIMRVRLMSRLNNDICLLPHNLLSTPVLNNLTQGLQAVPLSGDFGNRWLIYAADAARVASFLTSDIANVLMRLPDDYMIEVRGNELYIMMPVAGVSTSGQIGEASIFTNSVAMRRFIDNVRLLTDQIAD